MGGHMVTKLDEGVKEFYMVNQDDPEQACEKVRRCAAGVRKHPVHVTTALSDETLDHFNVRPGEPWLCFTTNANAEANIGEGWGIVSTAFSDDKNIADVGRGELHIT